jgi:membrane protein
MIGNLSLQLHTFARWPSSLKDLFVETYKEWSAAGVERMGAALAYYALLSLAPLLILVISGVSLLWDAEAVRGEVVNYLENFIGRQAAEAIQGLIQDTSLKGGGVIASMLGFLTLVWGATSVVAELQSSMDTLWKCRQPGGLRALLKQRSSAFIVIVMAGFLFLISMLMSAVVAAMGTFFSNFLPVPAWLLESVNSLLSLLLNTALCALLFKTIPKVSLEWDDVLLGAGFTAILLTIGKTAIGLYLGKAGFASTFGAAGSLVVIMVWVYYSAQLFFFGAEFTRVYAGKFGSRPAPPDGSHTMET